MSGVCGNIRLPTCQLEGGEREGDGETGFLGSLMRELWSWEEIVDGTKKVSRSYDRCWTSENRSGMMGKMTDARYRGW